MADLVRRRLRVVVGLAALAELVVFVLVAAWIGLGWTIVATVLTSALGWVLLARQGRRALVDLRERARSRESAGRELGDAGLVAVGGLLMVLPGFLGDVLGLLCLLPGTRGLVRRALMRVVLARLPDRMRGPVRVGSTRAAPVDPHGSGDRLVIEGEVLRDPDSRG
ncbi:FxsA family protein [Blastococcus sp. VKM Ac-2987]|uniref:FxsA family protein n=1 Tax=Blastococcus sp. VKM Ac-2987 TaxID=3004141 RepID=UPI0022AB9A58|nr:FxsA family protein [Blastococcus sp. VKM Ac-2987]MCZ2860944.1 FxsA family protein [Blastococcus sp. VKM Ac-2987]